MIRVENVQDMELVRLVLTMPHIWDAMTDDYFPPQDQFCPRPAWGTYYLGCWDDDDFLGFGVFYLTNSICCDAHVVMLPNCGGKRALKAWGVCRRWLWDNTNFRRIITSTPRCNTLGMKFAKLAGFKPFGVNPNSWLKKGKLHDLVLSGVDYGRDERW